MSIDGLAPNKVAQLMEAIDAAVMTVVGDRPATDDLAATLGVDIEGWSCELRDEFLRRLRDSDAGVQADVVSHAAENGGVITREDVYAIGEYPPGRSLKGFTRPINRVVNDMVSEGLLPRSAPTPLAPVYSTSRSGYQRAGSFSVPASIVPIFSE